MIREQTFTIGDDEAGERFDRVLSRRFPSAPRAQVVAAIAGGAATLNGRPAPKGAKVRAGDRAAVAELAEASDVRVQPQPELPLAVVYADAGLLALDKPAGQPTQPLSFRETGTLANALAARYPEVATVGGDPLMGGILHRLDAGTSGLVLAARNEAAYAALREQFRQQTVRKVYLAVVEGEVAIGGRLEAQLAHLPSQRGHMIVLGDEGAPEGQRPLRAVTEYEPLEYGAGRTLLRVTIFTGVTHQIRCQLAHAGFPIVGDAVYGTAPAEGTGTRHLLHAAEITLAHPASGEALTIACPPPAEFAAARRAGPCPAR
jgi:23S rRNA pseudouridine1911/1915/1917 synthase